MTTPLLACFLAALLAEGHALSCVVCKSTVLPTCHGALQTCASASDVCVTKYTVNNNGGPVTTEYTRSCGSPTTECGRIESMTAQWLKVRANSTCCNTNNCSSPLPTVPTTDLTLNGQTCSTCVSLTSTYCYTTDTMKCTGIENKCAILGIKTSAVYGTSSISFRGCANPNLCANFAHTSTFEGITTDLTMACSNNGIRPEHVLLLPLLAGLLLLKLFS